MAALYGYSSSLKGLFFFVSLRNNSMQSSILSIDLSLRLFPKFWPTFAAPSLLHSFNRTTNFTAEKEASSDTTPPIQVVFLYRGLCTASFSRPSYCKLRLAYYVRRCRRTRGLDTVDRFELIRPHATCQSSSDS